jgi:hypothetical protein
MPSVTAPALAAPTARPLATMGLFAAAFVAMASPFGSYLAAAFAEGWIAVYMDAAAYRLFCI